MNFAPDKCRVMMPSTPDASVLLLDKPNPALCYIRSSCRNLVYQCMHLGYQLGDFEWLGDNVVLVDVLARRRSRIVGRRSILPFLLLVPW